MYIKELRSLAVGGLRTSICQLGRPLRGELDRRRVAVRRGDGHREPPRGRHRAESDHGLGESPGATSHDDHVRPRLFNRHCEALGCIDLPNTGYHHFDRKRCQTSCTNGSPTRCPGSQIGQLLLKRSNLITDSGYYEYVAHYFNCLV